MDYVLMGISCISTHKYYIYSEDLIKILRLDNTGAWVAEVFPLYLSNQMT